MHAPAVYDATCHAWPAAGSSDVAFRQARRHSRRVRFLRAAIPFAIMAGIAMNVLGDWVKGSGMDIAALSKTTVSGTKITMDQPRMSGYTRDGRAYEMRAQTAVQDLKTPNLIDLTVVHNKMKLLDGRTVDITADTGTYDSKKEMMVLRNNVLCVASDGTEVKLSEMTLDVRKGHVMSQNPVEVVQPSGQINANQLEVVDNGAVVHFRGRVRYRTSLSAEAEEPASDAERPRLAQ
jgi:lipopolysaccharide export system protein LptC